jgi:hypothetical protein
MNGPRGEAPGGQGETPAVRIKPIRPEEVRGEREIEIPEPVIDTFNALIRQNFRRGRDTIISAEDVVGVLVEKGFDRGEILDKKWLDVEDIYGDFGWDVAYESPDHSGLGHFTFTPSRIRDPR